MIIIIIIAGQIRVYNIIIIGIIIHKEHTGVHIIIIYIYYIHKSSLR